MKSGPNAINRDDVTTVKDAFKKIKNLARTNNVKIDINDLIFCLIYGAENEKNSFVKELEVEYTVFIGQEFWHRLTGDPDFYRDLIQAAGDEAKKINGKAIIDDLIKKISVNIEKHIEGLGK